MATLINIGGEHKDVLPLIYKETEWVQCIPWVFSDGMWRRTYDPGFVNLVTNSRLINGTDVSVSQGKISGVTPIGWTLGTMTAGSSYSTLSFADEEQVKSVRFISEQSRHYYITRISVEEGNTYTASAMIEQLGVRNGRKVLSVTGETASIEIDVDFDISKNMKLGRNEIQFYARTSGIVQFRIGACVDGQGDGDVTISRPQITKSFMDIPWQPTPIIAPYYGVTLLESYIESKDVLSYGDGEYSFDMTIRIEKDFNRPIMLFGRNESSGFSGLGFDERNMFVYRSGIRDRSAALSKHIPINRLIGLKIIWHKSGNYVSDIRLYLNGELIGRIPTTLYSGNIDCLFGYSGNRTTNLTVQSFNLKLKELHAFNVDEGKGNQLFDRNTDESFRIYGTEFIDFVWIQDMSPPIIITDTFDQVADIGSQVRFYADATFYLNAQWYKNDSILVGATGPELYINSVSSKDYGEYFCVFQNEFGSVKTSIARLKSPSDRSERMATEDGQYILTEDGIIILTEA